MNFIKPLQAFLDKSGWGEAEAEPFCADFSSRSFARLKRGKGKPERAILMLAPTDQKTPQFVAISDVLRQMEISAPLIYAHSRIEKSADKDGKLDAVIMEDFGNSRFGDIIESSGDAKPLLTMATNLLAHMHRRFKPEMLHGLNLPVFNARTFEIQAELFLENYFPIVHRREANAEEKEGFRDAWRRVLSPLDGMPQTLVLRDFMPDNLMNLPEREGWKKVGVLDFQDGGSGLLPYDIASLCEEIRRDGGLGLMDDITEHYHAHNSAIGLSELRRACAVLAAQRHARVLGILTKPQPNGAENACNNIFWTEILEPNTTEPPNIASETKNKTRLSFIPRTLNSLRKLLASPALTPVKEWMEKHKTV